jgi:hypothetical protein
MPAVRFMLRKTASGTLDRGAQTQNRCCQEQSRIAREIGFTRLAISLASSAGGFAEP